MSMVEQANRDIGPHSATQAGTVIMGRQDYMSVIARLVGMELYKLRHRAMSFVLGTISVLAVVIVFLLLTLVVAFLLNSSVGQEGARSTSDLLRLPLSLYLAVQIAFTLGQVLIVILVGTIAGGEYGVGTLRLLFTRGPARTQFLIAKIGTAALCIIIGVLVMTVLGILLGQALNLITGISTDFAFFNASWLGYACLYVLCAMLGLFTYAMMALFLATLGRSTAVGIAGALIWILVAEPVVNVVCNIGADSTRGSTAAFFRTVPNYLISTNITALQQNQGQQLFQTFSALAPGQVSDLHAVLVLAGYLILFIGLSWWINERRDVTN